MLDGAKKSHYFKSVNCFIKKLGRLNEHLENLTSINQEFIKKINDKKRSSLGEESKEEAEQDYNDLCGICFFNPI